jgi:hypothetical protein
MSSGDFVIWNWYLTRKSIGALNAASPRPFGSVIYIGYMVEGKDGYEVERVMAAACRRCSDR